MREQEVFTPNFKKDVIPPAWLANLAPGKYEVKEIIARTGLSAVTILKRFKKYGCIIERIPVCHNLFKYLIHWGGMPSFQERRAR